MWMRWWKYIYLIACWICWLALAYPFCCMVVLYVAVLSCDDHQLGWWEQMGEVLMVNKRMMIPLLSHLGWSFPCVLFRATAHVSLSVFSTLRSMLYSYSTSLWHRGVPEFCQGSVKDPRTTLLYLYCVTFSFNFA